MSISTALTALADDVDAAKEAIEAKGGTAPSGTADMADAIAAIPSGGGVEDVTINGESVVTDGVAEIDLSDYALKSELEALKTRVAALEA